jgi:hypothetical protein
MKALGIIVDRVSVVTKCLGIEEKALTDLLPHLSSTGKNKFGKSLMKAMPYCFMPFGGHSIANAIDHTLLKPNATHPEIQKLCEEAHEHNFFAVCVNGSRVAEACRSLCSLADRDNSKPSCSASKLFRNKTREHCSCRWVSTRSRYFFVWILFNVKQHRLSKHLRRKKW